LGRSIIGTQIIEVNNIHIDIFASETPSPQSGGSAGAVGYSAILISNVIMLGALSGR